MNKTKLQILKFRHSILVERGVSSHGEAKRASGEAAANMGDGEG